MLLLGESLILGPNIKRADDAGGAGSRALAALKKRMDLAPKANEKVRALIAALEKRLLRRSHRRIVGPRSTRRRRGDEGGRAEVSARRQRPGAVRESLMDTQPWEYWEAGGGQEQGQRAPTSSRDSRGRRAEAQSPPRGRAHLYIHAMEASSNPEKALPQALRLGSLAPGAGHLVHMPAHIYYRIGMYRESLDATSARWPWTSATSRPRPRIRSTRSPTTRTTSTS
jgi:hypothetical protein